MADAIAQVVNETVQVTFQGADLMGALIAQAEAAQTAAEAAQAAAEAAAADAAASALDAATIAGSVGTETPDGYAFAWVDGAGQAAGGLLDDGTLKMNALESETFNGVPFADLLGGDSAAAAATERNYTAEVNHVLSYGQSLSTGVSAGTDGVVTTTQRFDNLRFAGGVRSQDSGSPYTSLVPLIETIVTGTGETPIGGATDMIKERILAEDALAYTDHHYQMLGSAPGQAAQMIAALSKPGSLYTRLVNDMTNGYSLSQAAGKTFKVQAVFWTQGESDRNASTPAATYKAAMVQLRNDIDADAKAITGQAENVVMISYQTSGNGDQYLGNAQWEVQEQNPNHYVATAEYAIAPGEHLSPTNYKKLGAYYGLCYKRVVIDGDTDWRPCQPIHVERQGVIVLARFHVPAGILVFDTTTLPARTNRGFTMVNNVGAAISISSVTIVGPDLVKIICATAPPAGSKLRYGYNSLDGGNLRDQQGDEIIFNGNGINHPMHNWCVVFEKTIT